MLVVGLIAALIGLILWVTAIAPTIGWIVLVVGVIIAVVGLLTRA